MPEEIEKIKLMMINRTKLDLIFKYNDVEYSIKRNGTELAKVEPGHRISVRDPNHTLVTRRKITVESDLFVSIIDRDMTIICQLTGWQLQLQVGSNDFAG